MPPESGGAANPVRMNVCLVKAPARSPVMRQCYDKCVAVDRAALRLRGAQAPLRGLVAQLRGTGAAARRRANSASRSFTRDCNDPMRPFNAPTLTKTSPSAGAERMPA